MSEIDRTKLNNFIIEYFNDDEIHFLCAGDFRDVYNDFTNGMGKKQKVLNLTEWCYRRRKTADLLLILQRERPSLFETYFAQPVTPKIIAPQAVTQNKRNPRQIFISHAHEDAQLAQRFAQDLEAEGWGVWIAPDSIQSGERWVQAINRGLDESGIFLLLLSPEAVASKWVCSETNVAIELEHEGELRLVPIQVQVCKLPALWRSYQRLSFRGGYEKALGALLGDLEGRQEGVVSSRMERIGDVAVTVAQVEDRRMNPISGKEMIWIPAGEFLYGDDKKSVYLDEFWMAKTAVTNAEYAKFVQETKHRVPDHWESGKPPSRLLNHPVVYVSWDDAQAYTQWAGCSLPTEQEWEKSARGISGFIYPWGDAEPTDKHCNFGNNVDKTTSVRRYSPLGDSPYGCVDMSGNVWEWADSWYDDTTRLRVLRGGVFSFSYMYCHVCIVMLRVEATAFRTIGTTKLGSVLSNISPILCPDC